MRIAGPCRTTAPRRSSIVPSSSARRAAVTPTVKPASAGTTAGAALEEAVVITGSVTLVRSEGAPTSSPAERFPPHTRANRTAGTRCAATSMVVAAGDRAESAVFPWGVADAMTGYTRA